VNTKVQSYYDNSVEIEWTRMDRHPLEFEITKRHIEQFIQPESQIVDIGGGPGKYSFYFASKGHKVTLIDLSPNNISYANKKQIELGISLEKEIVGNAIDISFIPSETYDVVLCMGPLYHLIDVNDRNKVINECKRVVKKNGFIVFSFITVMAQTISLLKRNSEKIDEWFDYLVNTIGSGINNPDFDSGFTEAFFIHPFEIEEYINRNGLEVIKLAGAEGFANQSEELLIKLPKDKLGKWIDFTYKYTEDKSILGSNQHVICIAKIK
jgi:S-adenosylmethionine-dependent methyltransferase